VPLKGRFRPVVEKTVQLQLRSANRPLPYMPPHAALRANVLKGLTAALDDLLKKAK